MSEPKKYGLKLNEKATTSAKLPVPSVFGNDSDSDSEIIAKEKDANKKFQMKYGSNKTRDQRAVDEALADDPDVYEYDSLYDQMESKRNSKTEEQKEADKKREPKYAHKIVLATQKRQMEKLMVDERKQAKEREAEGEQFKDKDAFVTGAYKKQIEERKQIRKELEEQDRMDGRLKVEDQSFWQANFNRRLLDDVKEVKPITSSKVEKMEIDAEETEQVEDKKLFKELKPGLNQPKKSRKSPSPERRPSRRDRDDHHHHRSRDHENSRHRRRRHDSSASPSPRKSKENDDGKSKKPEKPKSDKEILYDRLKKVKEILKQRNNDSSIFMARQRYLQRKQNGEIRACI